jgi:hypothetical protein
MISSNNSVHAMKMDNIGNLYDDNGKLVLQ